MTLPATLDTGSAADLLAAVHKAVYRGRPVEVDCSQVSRINTQCAQILVAADLDLARVDLVMTAFDCSDEFVSVMTDLGLSAKLEAWRAHP